MSIATHALKYGWAYLATLTLGTGTIFMVNPILNRITLHDRVEIFLAVAERCMATQTGTNSDGTPIYAVAPPAEVRTWYDSNGEPVTVTNSIEWRDDLSMKKDIDAKIQAVCPYYVDTNSVYDGTTNIVMCTFTGLLTSLDLGDHTNFTSIPATGTNAATYGPWAWRNYIVAWQERYKVLNALKVSRAYRNSAYNGSHQEDPGGHVDFEGYYYSNKVTHVISPIAYNNWLNSEILGLENGYYYSSSYSNNVPTNNWVGLHYDDGVDYGTDFLGYPCEYAIYNISWANYQTIEDWWYFHQKAYFPNTPPWTPYPSGWIAPTNETGLGAGYWSSMFYSPYEAWAYDAGYKDWRAVSWYQNVDSKLYYSTWDFYASYPNQSITSTYAIYLKLTLPQEPTNTVNWIEGGHAWPASWEYTADPLFEEFAGMTLNEYSKLDESFLTDDNGKLTVVFGSDQFAPIATVASQPPYSAEPTKSTGYNNANLVAGSIGRMKGMYLDPANYFFIKDWQFNYCTVKYW